METYFPCRNRRCKAKLVAWGERIAGDICCPLCGDVQPVPRPPGSPSQGEPPGPAPAMTVGFDSRGFARAVACSPLCALAALPRTLLVILVFIGAYSIYKVYLDFFAIAGSCAGLPVFPLVAGLGRCS